LVNQLLSSAGDDASLCSIQESGVWEDEAAELSISILYVSFRECYYDEGRAAKLSMGLCVGSSERTVTNSSERQREECGGEREVSVRVE
jgi:hypothetical protein